MSNRNSDWEEFESEDGMFGFGMKVIKAIDVDKLQSFIDYMRLRYSQLNGLKCFDYKKDLDHLIGCEVGNISHVFYQLKPETFKILNWSDGFDEMTYRRLIDEVIMVLSRFHSPDLRDRIDDNAPYWSKDLAKAIQLCDQYVKERGGEGTNRQLAGAWLKAPSESSGPAEKMPGDYDWIVCEPLAIHPQHL